jgi:myo-inositol 2-dehydrogenase / D-chiro-inositol 1-dehydrogenase
LAARGSVRVGLAGLGRFGKLHAAILNRLPGVELVAVCDPRDDEVQAVTSRCGAAGHHEFEDMLDRANLDAVFIVSTEPLHASQAMAAIDRGIAVFVEKPLAMTADEGERVMQAAQAAGVPLQVGLVLRFETQHRLLKTAISRGELGRLVSMRVKRNVSKSWFPDYGDRAHPIHDTAIHDIDLLLWFGQSPVTTVRALQRNFAGMLYPEACWALLEFANGAVGFLETSWFVPAGAPANVVTPTWKGTIDAEAEIIGDVGTGRIRLLDAPLSFWSNGFTAMPESGLWPELGGSIGGALREELSHFLDRVREGAPESVASVADAVTGLRVAEAILTSAESESVVRLNGVG